MWRIGFDILKVMVGIGLLIYVSQLDAQQPTPVTPLAKCIIPFTINSTGTGTNGHLQPSTTGYDNRQTGCTNWGLYYSSSGYSAISIQLESAPVLSNVAPGTPGSYVVFAGTTLTGANPMTATTFGLATFYGYYPWIRVNASTLTGSGVVTGVLIGSLPISVTGGGPSSGTCPDPCPVIGAEALAATPTKPPVYIGGWDAFNDILTRLASDSNGNLIASQLIQGGTGSSDISDSTQFATGSNGPSSIKYVQQVFPYSFDGTVWKANFGCTLSAPISTSSSGNTQLVALLASAEIRICNINWASATPISVSLVYGHGSACATGEIALTGVYANTANVDFNFGGTLKTAAGEALCIKLGSAVSTTGVVTYAKIIP